MINFRKFLQTALALAVGGFMAAAVGQTVSIPDPGLNAAVREALQKPTGPLTPPDMLRLTVLNAHDRNITSLTGLEAASNLSTLLLQGNHLRDCDLSAWPNLAVLDLANNSLTNVTLSGGATNLFSLILADNGLTRLALPADLPRLEELDLSNNQLGSLELPPRLTGLGTLNLGFNGLTNFFLPAGLTNLDILRLSGNALTNFTVPAGLNRLSQLYLDENELASFTLPAGVTNLHVLDLFFNRLTSLDLPSDQQHLIELDLANNRFASLSLPATLTGLTFLHLRSNQLTDFSLPEGLKALSQLDLGENQLQSVGLPADLGHLTLLRLSGNTNLAQLALPSGLTNLTSLFLRSNGLTNLLLPPDLNRLLHFDALGNRLSSFTVPPGLNGLTNLILSGNLLTNLTLPPDLTHLSSLVLEGNPLTQLVLSEPQAASVTDTVAALQQQGIPVFIYPLTIQLKKEQRLVGGAIRFAITGPPGDYMVFSSTNLWDWTEFGVSANPLGSILIADTTAQFSPQKYYRVERLSVPANLAFIAPNTFTMGSPTSEVGHQSDEGPQTVVTLSHGFWIGKFPVTQGEYLAVTGENPSGFPGDLSRPVESVSFFAASNYCAQLTLQDRSAGRIPLDTHYRLPTEAEWECAARAGTSTRFYYGDDPTLSRLSDYAWFGAHNGATTHPVGQKLPNAWGLYDMAGNVWEWCQDWYGTYPGGAVTDPPGPASNPIGWKVIRGGAWEASEFDCRSASRNIEAASPFISDFIIGFRVVLVSDH
jgi:formylglycine-generating enzyme required for sulfatase activity